MAKRPTQSDVARLAGVSRATVSYVINQLDGEHASVGDETRLRVLAAVEQLGYRPDARAQSLRSGLTHTIGVLIPDLRNPYYWQFIAGIEQQLQAENYNLLLTSISIPDLETQVVDALSRRRVDGLVLMLTYLEQLEDKLNTLAKNQMPVVVTRAPIMGGAMPLYDCVEPSYHDGALQVMQHLIDLGHQQIGFVFGVRDPQQGMDRLTAYRESLAKFGLPYSETLIQYCGATLDDGYQAARRLLNCTPRPTAIMTINDLLAVGVMRAILDAGLRVPEDISVAGFDDIELAAYINPTLTTLRANGESMGRAAVRLLINRLRNPALPQQVIHIPHELIVRQSTGRAPDAT